MRSHWDEDPDYPVADWKYEVANDDTRQSYREWVESRKSEILPLNVGETVEHLKRGSRYEIIGFTEQIPNFTEDGARQVINHEELGAREVFVQHSDPNASRGRVVMWVLYEQIDGDMVFARPDHEFTGNRFKAVE